LKNNTPLALRLVRWVFPKLELISSSLALTYFEKIFFTPIRYKATPREGACELLARKEKIYAAGKEIQTYEWGNPALPYVLVIHGWAGRATQFRKFVPVFNDAGFRVLGFDGPAHGQSEGKRTDISEFSIVLQTIIKQKGIPQAIITHSFGGGVALYSIMNGLPVTKLINVASPTIADEIIKSYLKAIGGSWKTGEQFKKLVAKKYGKPFEEFTAMYFVKRITNLRLMLVHDTDDRDVSIVQAQELVKAYPQAFLLTTHGLGHNRILKDDSVITECLNFVRN
jgi:esterase/lipase